MSYYQENFIGGGTSSLTINSTPIIGATGAILWDDAGVLQEVTIGSNLTFSGGVLSAGAGSGIVVNTTTISGGTSGHVVYDNAGTFGEAANFTILSSPAGYPNAALLGYFTQSKPAVYVVPNVSGDNWFEGEAGNTGVTGYQNFGTGTNALLSVTSGFQNTAIGSNALLNCTTGQGHTAFGGGALQSVIDDNFGHVAIGQSALNQMVSINGQTLSGCVAIGQYALFNCTRGGNVAIGNNSLQTIGNGANNLAIGADSFQTVNGGTQNVGIGQATAQFMTSGSGNIFVGQACGQNLTSGSFNTWLGPGYFGVLSSYNFTFALALGSTLLFDRGITGASNQWSFPNDLNTPGIVTTNASGTLSVANTVVTAGVVPVNFSANGRVAINIGGTTYYVPVDTAPW
jgi:hypothetical protein